MVKENENFSGAHVVTVTCTRDNFTCACEVNAHVIHVRIETCARESRDSRASRD